MKEVSTLTMIACAVAATVFWRVLGVYVGRRFSADHPLIGWANAVAYSTVTALTVKLLVLPEGALALTSGLQRLEALAVAVVVFYVTRRNVLLACLAGVAVFAVLLSWH